MINPIKDLTKGVDSIGNAIDKNVESGEERQEQLSNRHAVDMKSDSWLSKNVRPVTLLALLVLEIFFGVASTFGYTPTDAILLQHGTLMVAAIGFYFNSKKGERIAQKNVEANIALAEANVKIKEASVREEIKLKRKEERLKRRLERREARKNN